ncbi:uncharacterized protein [Choristoneura fumiferana]|uniref:uncharacterized protein n=1 Tax=Choristoneura fumiferana TaxID=7141 RepID=UPI003D15728D
MAQFLIWFGFCFINAILCYDSESSSELNRIEYTPLYETIIYSDIADIIKDFENTMNSPVDALINNDDSESDENIDDLLSEYQHYLDKAHKQRRTYLEKSKPKNKVPLLQHDRYSKSKSTQTNKHDDFYPDNINYYNPGPVQYPQPEFKTPLDFLIPINVMKSRFLNNFEPVRSKPKEKSIKKSSFDKMISEENMLQLPPAVPSVFHDSIKSSCYCETDTFPCECGCKQCLMPLEPMQRKHSDYDKFVSSPMFKPNNNDNSLRGLNDNTLNIRIKVDVQFPKFQDSLGEMFKNTSNDKIVEHGSISRESNINFPFPYFNFPIPLEMLGLKKPNENSAPIHKITIHRKKKSKSNSNGKRHRKKLITFHNIKLEQQNTAQPSLEENYNTSDHQKIDDTFQYNEPNKTLNHTENDEHGYSNISMNQTAELTSVNNTKTGGSIYVTVDIKNNDNITEDIHRNENSIETDYIRVAMQSNVTTETPLLRKKRDVSSQNDSTNLTKKPEVRTKFKRNNNANENNSMKKTDKNQLEDTELLYWPSNLKNLSGTYTHNNITTLILDTENKKTKLNFSTESIRHNRTKALEQAIFGDVDWDDVGTVAPVFMSFMGKYIRGVLTFCSESICHSMKCADKNCVHRICAPSDRLNNKGHCTGSNSTDSVASMEAILDLPSNVALEIVDILQDKLLGKLFGKVTLCISGKCVSFVASKKNFFKTKCSSKDLTASGHCPNIKNVKIV